MKKNYTLIPGYINQKSQDVTVDYLIGLEKWARKNAIVPLTVRSKKEAESFNRIEKILGSDQRFKMGDKYYMLQINKAIFTKGW